MRSYAFTSGSPTVISMACVVFRVDQAEVAVDVGLELFAAEHMNDVGIHPPRGGSGAPLRSLAYPSSR